MSKQNLYLGKIGEEEAVGLLKDSGYRILQRNYKTRLGEIDIIAEEKGVICFIEVKTRQTDRFGLPSEAVSKFKQRQIAKCALAFLKEKNILDKKARFDIVSIIYSKENPKLDLIRDAFELDNYFLY